MTLDLFDTGELEFRTADRWCRISLCERYTVSKADMGEAFEREHGTRFRYTAWRRGLDRDGKPSGRAIPQMLGCFDSAAEAEDDCRKDSRARQAQPQRNAA
jgi:hypothetical protein